MILKERLPIWVGARRVELTKVLAEIDQLRIRKRLVVEDNDQPLAPNVLNGLDIACGYGLRQVEPGDLCAQRGSEVFDRERHHYSSVQTMNLDMRPAPIK